LGTQLGFLLLRRRQGRIYFFRAEEITRIKDQYIFTPFLYFLYCSCPSGKTARPGCPSPCGIDLAVDVVAVKDVDLSDFTPREGSYSCNEEKERDNDSHQSLTHRYPSP
jgi:hypothetical protein